MTFNVDEFRSYMSKNGVLRTSHFAMTIPKPPGLVTDSTTDGKFNKLIREMGFAVEATNLPGVSLATDEIRRYGYGSYEKKPYVPIFADVNVRVICDREGKLYDFFQTWMKLIINYDNRKGSRDGNGVGRFRMDPYELSYKKEYAVDVEIRSYTETGQEAVTVTLLEAYPIFVGDINLSWNDTNSIVKLPVTFTFRDWHQGRDIRNPNQIRDNPNTGSRRIPDSELPAFTPNKR